MGIKQSKRSVEISSTPKKGAVDVPVQVDILFENMQYSPLLRVCPSIRFLDPLLSILYMTIYFSANLLLFIFCYLGLG